MVSVDARTAYRKRHPERDKQARREASKRWREKHPEKYAASNRKRAAKYRANFPEKCSVSLKAWYAKNKDKVREYNLLKTFGITVNEWEEKFSAQGRKCGCCGSFSPNGKKGWQTDHCHKTGKLRDILCTRCNLLLTRHFEEFAEQALAYLRRHREG